MQHVDGSGSGGDERDRRLWVERRRRLRSDRAVGRKRRLFRDGSNSASHSADWERHPWTSRLLHHVGEAVANSSAGIVAACLVGGWAAIGMFTGFPGWWQTVLYSVTASVTFVMVFVIQHTQSRQTLATQRKLDELLRATVGADDALIAVEEAPGELLRAFADLNMADRDGVAEQGSDA